MVRARTVRGDVHARNERLEVRMTREDKDLVKQAAALEGVPTTQFVTGALRRGRRADDS